MRFTLSLRFFGLWEFQPSTKTLEIISPDLLIWWHVSPGDQWSGSTSAISPPPFPQTYGDVDLVPVVLLDNGRSKITSRLRNFGKFTLMCVQSAKAHAPYFDHTVFIPLCCDPMDVVSPPPELLISSDLEYFLSVQRFQTFLLLRVHLLDPNCTIEMCCLLWPWSLWIFWFPMHSFHFWDFNKSIQSIYRKQILPALLAFLCSSSLTLGHFLRMWTPSTWSKFPLFSLHSYE